MPRSSTFNKMNSGKRFLRVLVAFSIILISGVSNTNAQSYTQDFSFSGTLTSNGWTAHSGSGNSALNTTTGLTYLGHQGSSVGNAVLVGNAGGEDVNQTFTSIGGNGTVVYCSFLINVTEPLDRSGDYLFHLGSSGGSTFSTQISRVFVRTVSGNVNFGISNTATVSWGTTNFSKNTTYLVVLKYSINTSGADPVAMWVIPSGIPATEATAGTPEINNTTTSGSDAIAAIAIRQGGTSSITSVLDAIRIGTSWSTVVPATSPIVVTGSASSITSTEVTLNGTVNANGNSSTVSFGYGLTTSYGSSATGTPSPVTGNTVTNVSATFNSLTPNTLYNYRIQATNTGGTANGSNQTFRTLANVPSAPSVSNSATSSLTVTINANSNPASTQFAIQEIGGNYVQTDGSLSATPVWQTVAVWGSKEVTGLSSGTTYTFQVKARNADLVETAFSATSSGTTTSANAPAVTTTGTISAFSGVQNTPTFSKNFSLSGANLTDTVFVSAPSSFEVATDTSTWQSTLKLLPASGSVSATIYVRMNATSFGSYSGNVNISSTGAVSQIVALSGTAIALEPSTQSSITISGVASTSATVNLSGGNGTARMVVAATTPIIYLPTDGASPSGINSTFSSAIDQGSGNRVVYSGTANSFTLDGIAASTTYYLASYEYNGTGVTANYFTNTPGTTNFTTIAATPTTASSVAVTRIKLDSLFLSFTGGNGANRIVVLAQGGAVTFTPVNGTTYTGISNNFSLATDQGTNNRIVYSGSATSVAVTGLNRNTVYGIKVIELNGTGSTTSYFITAAGSGTVTTPGYVAYSTASSNYTQNFNTLPSTGLSTAATNGFGIGPYFLNNNPVNASTVLGWQYANQIDSDVRILTDNGSSLSGAVFSYGATSNTERAMGVLASSSMLGAFGVTLENTTGVNLYTATVSFDGEQWRNGGSGASNQLKMQYNLGAANILSGTWTDVPAAYFNSPVVSTTAGAVDGNANAVPITATFILNGSWAPGQTLNIRWVDTNEAGNDDGIGIDNFSFSAAPASAPTLQDSTLTFTSVFTTSMTANWINGNGIGRIVVINTTNSFTDPVNGTAYTANTVYSGSGQQVVYNGSGSSVNITGLTAATTYYFRVYAYNGAGVSLTYATQTATGNPISQASSSIFPPTDLRVVNVNNGNPVLVNQPFSITIEAIDAALSPQPVLANTTVDLSVIMGVGLLSGNTIGTITAGNSSVTITGVIYDTPEFDVQLDATASAGDVLNSATSASFVVYDVASFLDFTTLPTNAVNNVVSPLIRVSAFRSDFTVDQYYTANVTLSVVSGPGTISGTLTKAAVAGVVDFNDVVFSTPGTYVIRASSGSLTNASTNFLVTAPIVMNELAVPRFFGSKTTASTNTNRTPVFACISFDNLLPNTTYNLAAGLALPADASNSIGVGSLWNGSAFSGNTLNNAFTTNTSGSSGPVWIAIQPSGNSTRFGAGEVHVIRLALSTSIFTTINAQYSTTNTLTPLDIASTAFSAATTDDGAYVVGRADTCMSGRFAIAYDNVSGTGQPLSISPITSHVYLNGAQAALAGAIDSVYANTATRGSFGFVVPIGANNANGVRFIAIRNAANVLVNSVSDADGIWPSGVNTTTLTRLSVARLPQSDVSLSTMTALTTSSTNVTCFNGNNGSATALATSSSASINYLWNPGALTTSTINTLTAGNYTVVAQDGFGCARSATVTITQPVLLAVTASNDGPKCIGDTVTLTATGGATYSWSGPSGFTATGSSVIMVSNTIANAGTYTVLVTSADGCTNTATTVVALTNCACTPPVLTATTVNACLGTASGSIDLTVNGGIAPITYLWSNGATTQDITGLLAGSYAVTVSDSVDCAASLTITVGNTTAPTITASGATTFCSGGSVTLTATAGDAYLWSNGATSQSITVSTSGSFSATVTRGACVATTAAVPVTVNSFSFTGNIFSESFGLANSTTSINIYTGYQNTSPISFNAGTSGTDVRNTTVSSGYSGASGAGNVFFGTNGGNLKTLTISGINTQNITGLTLSFGLLRTDANNAMTIEVSSDGTTFSALTASMPVTSNSWTLTTCSGTIPSTSNLTIRFSKSSNTSFRIDDVRLTGTATNLTGSSNAAMTVCGVGSAFLSANIASGVTWSTGATSRSIQVNTTGSYTFTATGSNGCSATSTAQVFTVNPEPTGSATAGAIACNGGTTTVTVGATGGVGPYTGTGTFTVSAGPQSYIITDVTGCDDTVSVTVTQPAVLNASSTTGTIACNGGSTTVTVSASGGTPTYTGTGGFTVSAGPYSYTVTDANGCTATTTGTVTEPSTLVASSTTGTIACNGGTTTVTVSATGGTLAYSGTGNFIVSAGPYSYTVTDSRGCTSTTTGTVSQPTAIVASSSYGNIACNGGSTTLTVSATGGTPSYSGTGNVIVSAGPYSYIVTDANGCTSTTSGTVTQPAVLVASANVGAIACNGGTTTIAVTANGGTPNYTGTGNFTVSAGPYSYTVTDANGCTSVTSGTMTQPDVITLTSFTPTSGIAGNTVTINGTGLNQVSAVKFGTLSATFTVVSSSQITATVPNGVITSAITLESACGNVISTGSFTVIPQNSILNLTVFIQGYYSGSGQMSPALYNQGISTDTMATDSITVELHAATSPYAMVFTATSILNINGDASFTFPAAASGNSYYIVVKGRNTMEVWSAAPVLFGSSTSFDFTVPAAPLRPAGNSNQGNVGGPSQTR
jgi:hypothetical protein